MPFDIFDTYYMAGMVQEIVPVQSFFRDRYFPTNAATDIFNSNKVLVEYRDRDRAMAPFVVRRAGGPARNTARPDGAASVSSAPSTGTKTPFKIRS